MTDHTVIPEPDTHTVIPGPDTRTVIPEMRSIIRDPFFLLFTPEQKRANGSRVKPGMTVPLYKVGSDVCASASRKNLNSLRDAVGGFPSLASLLALRINWRKVCALILGYCSINAESTSFPPSINLSRQASI